MLTIVFTFTSAWHNEAATGDGTPKNNKNEKEPTPKKEGGKLPAHWYASHQVKKQPERARKSGSH